MLNTEESSIILFPEQRRCSACGEPLIRPGARYCSRWCRGVLAIFEELTTLHYILSVSRWTGMAMTEEEYLRRRMQAAVRRLGHNADLLSEVLIEIMELLAEEADEPS